MPRFLILINKVLMAQFLNINLLLKKINFEKYSIAAIRTL